jgi:hypothetical protein
MRRFKWLWVALIWILLLFVMLEVVLRLAAPGLPGQIGTVARYITTGQPYSEQWTPAWQDNRDHRFALRPGITDALQYGTPTVSFQLTTIEPWEGAGIGLRNRPIDYRVDAVVVGDSFGFCFTEVEDCWVNILERETGMGIVNLSQPVTGSLSHLQMLRDFGSAWQPPLVIWQFFGNDFNDDYGLLQWRGDIAPIEDEAPASQPDSASDSIGGWLSRNLIAAALLEVITTGQWSGIPEEQRVFTPQYRAVYGDSRVLEFGKLYEREALDMSRPANQFGLEQSRAAFAEAQTLVAGWEGELAVVIIPTREEVYDFVTEPLMGSAELDRQRSARLAMLDLCESLDLACFDPLPVLQIRAQAGEALYYADDMHLNPIGNAALAAAFRDWLTEQYDVMSVMEGAS